LASDTQALGESRERAHDQLVLRLVHVRREARDADCLHPAVSIDGEVRRRHVGAVAHVWPGRDADPARAERELEQRLDPCLVELDRLEGDRPDDAADRVGWRRLVVAEHDGAVAVQGEARCRGGQELDRDEAAARLDPEDDRRGAGGMLDAGNGRGRRLGGGARRRARRRAGGAAGGGGAGCCDEEDEARGEEEASAACGAGGRRLVGHGAPDDEAAGSVPSRSSAPLAVPWRTVPIGRAPTRQHGA